MSAATIAGVLDYLLGRGWDQQAPPVLEWPPDVFAACAWILGESGAYVKVLEDWPPASPPTGPGSAGSNPTGKPRRKSRRSQVVPGNPPGQTREQWREWVRREAAAWRASSVAEAPADRRPPPSVAALWDRVRSFGQVRTDQCGGHRPLCDAMLELVALADEASAGAGLPPSTEPSEWDPFGAETCLMLLGQLDDERPSTLCRAVDPTRAVVLPKCRTPDNGITLRSLTHHLALVRACGVRPAWTVTPGPDVDSPGEHSINLLVVPWPLRMRPTQFLPASLAGSAPRQPTGGRGRHRYFTFEPDPVDKQAAEHVGRLCDAAEESVGRLDGVIFPEMALDPESFGRVEAHVRQRGIGFLVAGLYEPPPRPGALAENYACISVTEAAGGPYVLAQRKHHRWFLDDRQIVSYGLGSRLETTRKWWEHTIVGERALHFVAVSGWLTFTVLICEDLARAEPAGELVRAVGPNLVIALLQDGPQVSSRWPARAAHPLADDPGCSVLTLSGLGMVELMRTPPEKPRSRAVAMWRDRAETVEIPLQPQDEAIVLCLTNRYQTQWTADGRDDDGTTGAVGLAGVHGIRAPDVGRSRGFSAGAGRLAMAGRGGGGARRTPVDRR